MWHTLFRKIFIVMEKSLCDGKSSQLNGLALANFYIRSQAR